jgi:hypothetical protein
MGRESDLVAPRFARGSRCFGAWIGHELVGYGWWSTTGEWIGEVQLQIAPGEGEAYIWNCVTLDPHRRKGVFRSLVTSVVAQGRKEGLARLWIASMSSIGGNSIKQAGFEPIFRMDTATRFGLRWLRVKPVEGAPSALAAAAGEVMSIKPGMSLRRSRHKKH